MPSIIACPGCQNQLKIGKPFSGRKCRCPSCRTSFVLGNGPKAGEFLAFEVFDEGDQNNAGAQNGQSRDNSRGFGDKESIPVDFNLQLDILPQKDNEKFLSTDISVFEQPPAAKPQAPAEKKPPVINMELPGATRPIQPPAKPTQKPPAKPEVRPSPPPPVERKPEPKSPAKSGVNKIPRIPGPSKPPLPVSKPPALPPPPVHVSSDSSIEFKPIVPEIVNDIVPPLELEPPEEKGLPPDPPPLELESPNEKAIPPDAPAPPMKEVDEDYYLPKDYEITDDWPATPSQAPPRPMRTQSSSTAIQLAPVPATHDEEIHEQGFEEDTSAERAPSRSRRRYEDDRPRRRRGPREDMRGKWPIVMWGVTLELIAIFLGILGMLVMFLGGAVAGASLARGSLGGAGGGGVIVLIGALMLGGQGILRMVAYGLCIASPMRTGARVFAILALVFSLLSAAGYFGGIVIGHSRENFGQTGGGLFSIVAWFCFLFCLRAIAVALREDGIVEEIKMLMVWLGIFIGCCFVLGFFSCLLGGMLFAGAAASRDPDSAAGGMAVLGLLSCFFFVVIAIFAVVLFVKYIIILFRVRSAIAYKVG